MSVVGEAAGRGPGEADAKREGRPVRFRFLELDYGCHARRVEFDARDRPYVILGPNGAGKTTLLEAAVRTLYGFNRQRKDDRGTHEARRPWRSEAYRSTLGLEGPFGRWRLERDFETDEVVVREEAEDGSLLHRGDANPAASGREARAYRALLEEALGLPELEPYRRTACVGQGELIATELSEDLLRLAAGGHSDVEAARSKIREEHAELTRDPVADGETPRRRPGRIETEREAVAALEDRLLAARKAEERRRPLVEERETVEARLEALAEETRKLREASRGLSELERLEARREASLARVRRLERLHAELEKAAARLELLEERGEPEGRVYPDDFLERAAALEEGLWPERERLTEEARRREADLAAADRAPRPRELGLGMGGAAAALAGLFAAASGAGLAGGAAMAVGFLLAGAAVWLWRKRARTRRAAETELARLRERVGEVEARIRDRLTGVPDAGSLTPETLPDRRREFRRARRASEERREARRELRGALGRARPALLDAEAAEDAEEAAAREVEGADVSGPEAAFEEDPLSAAHELLERLAAAASEERNERLAPVQLALERSSRSRFDLPEGVDRSAAAVEAVLEERAREERELRGRLEETIRRLSYEARPEESPAAVEARLGEARARLARLEARAAALRHAFALLSAAYEEFRRTDQERLLEAISEHLARATGGNLGPVTAREGALEEARVAVDGRHVALASPPLSYGQLHSALFAVRLGASDFLAGFGIRLPLLVDDPFVHLDERRAAELWAAFGRMARERQVVVATQDRLLLEHLGVEPDLRLEPGRQVPS